MTDYGKCQASRSRDCGCVDWCDKPATHQSAIGERRCQRHTANGAYLPIPEMLAQLEREAQQERTIEALAEIWRANPDQRLCQLVVNVARERDMGDWSAPEVFYMTDEAFMASAKGMTK